MSNKSNIDKGNHGAHRTVQIIHKAPEMQGQMPRSSNTPHLLNPKSRYMKKEERELLRPANLPPPPMQKK